MKLSVIVPVYNVEKYLAECVESLLGQTLMKIKADCPFAAASRAAFTQASVPTQP